MGKARWSDGRPKVWFEIYHQHGDVHATATLNAAVRAAKGYLKHGLYFVKKGKVNPLDLLIYEVHSRGGWQTLKEDKVLPPRCLVEFMPKKDQVKALHELAWRCYAKGVDEDEQRLAQVLAKGLKVFK